MSAFKVEASDTATVVQIGAVLLASQGLSRSWDSITDAQLDAIGDLAVRAAIAFEWKARGVVTLRQARLDEEAAAEEARVAAEKAVKAEAKAAAVETKHGHAHR